MKNVIFFRRCVYYLIFTALLPVFLLISPAWAGDGVSFSWRANPVTDEVIGYRLYYGDQSRFAAGSYDYYIDFTSWQRCPAQGGGWGCEPLSASAVTCQDLYRDEPTCTVTDLKGRLFVAMTAYNAEVESDYTQELKYIPPEIQATLQTVFSLLLK